MLSSAKLFCRSFYPSGPKIGNSTSETSIPPTKNYKFVRTYENNEWVVLWINYPECKNYEGNKILVYVNTTLVEILNQDYIDPHFLEIKGRINPFARFRPTEDGWDAAVQLADKLYIGKRNEVHET